MNNQKQTFENKIIAYMMFITSAVVLTSTNIDSYINTKERLERWTKLCSKEENIIRVDKDYVTRVNKWRKEQLPPYPRTFQPIIYTLSQRIGEEIAYLSYDKL